MRPIIRYPILLLFLAMLFPATGYGFDIGVLVKKAKAQLGNAEAQSSLGDMYRNGLGVEPDAKKAFYWYRKLAEQGNASGQSNLGEMYQNGKGVEEDDEKAVYWLRKAAEQGNTDAQSNLGEMYQNGKGVEEDYEVAEFWYRTSAEQGNANAQYRLGMMYRNRGENYRGEAKYWFTMAVTQGHDKARRALRQLQMW